MLPEKVFIEARGNNQNVKSVIVPNMEGLWQTDEEIIRIMIHCD